MFKPVSDSGPDLDFSEKLYPDLIFSVPSQGLEPKKYIAILSLSEVLEPWSHNVQCRSLPLIFGGSFEPDGPEPAPGAAQSSVRAAAPAPRPAGSPRRSAGTPEHTKGFIEQLLNVKEPLGS